MRITNKYVFFFSERDAFSQWYPSPFVVKGLTFKTAEHYMMYAKASLFNDSKTAELILQCPTPREAKALGRKVSPFDPVLWDQKSTSYVRQASLAKFRQNPDLLSILLENSNKEFVEASPYDKIWGVGLSESDKRIDNPVNWVGKNLLGRVLTHVARELATEMS
ncbi:NADAR family protein [Vibrio sp. 10N.261.46.E12]|uniref:NADAR family protein n=1 Tax=unclassified Vibrio TaxID=2614977 RepID=UPI0009784A25|nr:MULTISPECIES: NADAR family protein [unclassified Vibrio]OMO36056.1 hypothetical protein BH584_05680 [Vibrio sp. 10N.261.45.E1]PMJ26892.1 hypothetical protein BCU27_08810 [Vibrio sp. 10N.286.45.B6]PML94183.1 hypothetical protein BCT66_24095 [Vibrio sp. 10N.261.49.E11]PMM82885.1 hypothetical protein BCT46_13690 [Vibrio sp. 10N.261.46.E8]PMN46314.1 hypothetical protein BCT32_10645 [Vibrio sp. 10N.261.45.E11]